jgi:DNA modification methylase
MIQGDAAQLIKDVRDKSVDLVLTDPPYDLQAIEQALYHDEFKRVCRGWIIVFCKPENQWHWTPDQYLFWVKPISTKNTSKSYSRFVEMICVYGNGHWDASRHWSQYTNVFTDLVDSKVHPYRKPPSMIERLILNHTRPGDTVLDPFAGSGTVPMVAERLGRKAIAFEMRPK